MPINYASKFAKEVDERFTRESQSKLGCSAKVDFTGVRTVNIYSIPTVPMNNYDRTAGSNRYGTPVILEDQVQEMTLGQDRAFTFTIDRMDRDETNMSKDAGKALSRQETEVIKPEIDAYTFGRQVKAAKENGGYICATPTKANAYELFLKGSEHLGNELVPDSGRIAYCSYAYANFLMQDPAFMRDSEASQEMILKGIMGTIDGCKIVKVPASRLPKGVSCLVVHPSATAQAMRLQDFKVHDNPPGINGWLVEGRVVYDAFVFNSKAKALFVIDSTGAMGTVTVTSEAGNETGKTKLTLSGNYASAPVDGKLLYKAQTGAATVNYGSSVTGFTEWNGTDEITITAGQTITIAVVDGEGKAIASGTATAVVK